ncbi:MAG TPA: GCN5 family acetyltransferase [Patescibacteria group bacterium]|nr:GCN5 family acetyltransferase [Patescibacteria group bacterium]
MIDGKYPPAIDPKKVGTYSSKVFSGGGYFYDDVLEYRVWTKENSKTMLHSFSTYEEASNFSKSTSEDAEKPLVLVFQKEYVAEDDSGRLTHVKQGRITEWQVDWLTGNKGTHEKIPSFIEKSKNRI